MSEQSEAHAEPAGPCIDRYRHDVAERIVAMLPEAPEEAGIILAMADRILRLPGRPRGRDGTGMGAEGEARQMRPAAPNPGEG